MAQYRYLTKITETTWSSQPIQIYRNEIYRKMKFIKNAQKYGRKILKDPRKTSQLTTRKDSDGRN